MNIALHVIAVLALILGAAVLVAAIKSHRVEELTEAELNARTFGDFL
jgi:hypothetical protein